MVAAQPQSLTADSPSCIDPTLVSKGGPVVHNPAVHLIPWIPPSAANNAVPYWTQLVQFVEDFKLLPVWSVLSQYTDSNGPAAQTLRLVEMRTLSTPYGHDGTKASPIDIDDVATTIDNDPANGSFTPDDVYSIVIPQGIEACDMHASDVKVVNGIVVSNGACTFVSPGSTETTIFGFHGRTPAGRIYTVITGNAPLAYWFAPDDPLTDGYIRGLSHELAEAITNADTQKGYTAPQCEGSEVGDLCQNRFTFTQLTDATGTSQIMTQSLWSNSAHACPFQAVQISGVSPASANAGEDKLVTITGLNFVPGNTTFKFVDSVSCAPSSPGSGTSTTCTGMVRANAAGAPAGTQADVVVRLSALVGGPPIAFPSTPGPGDEFTFLGSGPQNCTGVWTCDGTTTVASFSCSPAPMGTHFALKRYQAAIADYGVVPTTVASNGVLGQGSNVAWVSERGYIPAPSETTLSYEVCLVDNYTNHFTCAAPIVLSGTSNHCTCTPTTCAIQMACNSTIPDGCGGTLSCGACGDGTACSAVGTCCKSGTTPDGQGGCVCAPRRCPRGTSWDASECACLGAY
jgi:hypothetical protein